jgi:hypothetical protein
MSANTCSRTLSLKAALSLYSSSTVSVPRISRCCSDRAGTAPVVNNNAFSKQNNSSQYSAWYKRNGKECELETLKWNLLLHYEPEYILAVIQLYSQHYY